MGELTPDLTDVPIDDDAEPEDAGVDHDEDNDHEDGGEA